ncbi:MAG: leucine--tRNA ligase [Candidatus Marsarchaeota archaeon]|nr:leucine--tRNA ligase [Candidatus Marsarchaeota archaeon]
MINYSEIEDKWQKAWAEAKIFEGEVGEKPPYMVTAAFPYADMPQHIGHLRTYGTADVLARYKRMRGFNVLFPMAFHASATPIIAIAKRIQDNDKELIETMKIFHVPDEDIKKMVDPRYIAEYFTKELETGMHAAGYSVDWRRKFVSIDPFFSKFVEWQFGILNSKGYLIQGKHPVGWCPHDNNAVGMHDTKHDVEPEIEVETAVRFKLDGEDAYFVCSTYRPETIFGVTNVFIKRDARYVLCSMGDDGKSYYISKMSADTLSHQTKITVSKELAGEELLGRKCANPMTGALVPVYPGFFVKEDVGTGVVMSVPAHAPFDYAALERLRKDGYLMDDIKPIKVLDVQIGRSLGDVSAGEAKPTQLDVPALAYLEILHTKPDAIDDMLEFATKLEYREESHWGKMIVKGYEGMSEPAARERVRKELEAKGDAFDIYVLQNAPVVCRCGTPVVVKVVDDQWFLNYGDAKWKDTTKEAFGKINMLPEKSRNAFSAAIDWIDLRAVARARGLGTKFPLDRNFIIEPLSDSTIYPSFYTISNAIRGIDVEKLKPEFFDYVYRKVGDLDAVAKSTGIDYSVIKRCREAFEYWYQYTSRHSGSDLVFNHLTMYIFNHVAVFDKAYWPKQIVTNALVNYEGEKMSKSLGNIVPLLDGVKKYGADPLRINIIGATDLHTESEFSNAAVSGIKERLGYLYDTIGELGKLESGELKRIDYWLYSKLSAKIEHSTDSMEKLELRDAYTSVFYESILELRRYFARGGNNVIAVKDFLSDVVLMLQPIAPHMAEEMWHMLDNDTFASAEKWPVSDSGMRNEKVELLEELVDSTITDAKQVGALMEKKTGKKAAKLHVIVASGWKRKLVNAIAKERNISKALESLQGEPASDKEQASKLAGALAKKVNEIRGVSTTQEEELDGLREASAYMAKQLGCEVSVEAEGGSRSQRAARSMPMKPSLDIDSA